MKNFITKYLHFCPKTGKFIGFKRLDGFSKLLFPLVGMAAIIWILIRVIPKPSRLSYPCMRTAVPIASGFIGYIAMLAISGVLFLRSKKTILHYPVFFLGTFIVFGLTGFVIFETDAVTSYINMPTNAVVIANQPMGVAQGIFPGRVVWVHNQNAVNQNCVSDSLKHAWWAAENNNQPAIDSMVSAAIDSLTGQKTDSAAWVALFKYNNAARGKGSVGYAAGEKIFIKINECSGWGGNFNTTDLSKATGSWYGMSETTPAMVTSVLHQLVDNAHIPQANIYVGDPIRNIYKEWYTQWQPKYPNVHYIGHDNYANLGREQVHASQTALIHYSDRGTVLHPNSNSYSEASVDTTIKIWHDTLYSVFDSVEYLINIPQLKGHMRAGMTLFAKNHFGSQTRGDASHLHQGLPCPVEMENDTSRLGYGKYRIQVDIMTSSIIRKKNLIFLLDGLWGTSFEQNKPVKFQMAPFNNTYSASVFASLDNVAIESVAYDFLRSEFTVARCSLLTTKTFGNGNLAYPQMRGADDYLHQAADSANWPKGIKYDPDSTGTYIASLGTHEHWNNATEKKYSRNLGSGNGIELLQVVPNANATSIANQQSTTPKYFALSQNYPNPFNPSTTIKFVLPERCYVRIAIYNVLGQFVTELVNAERQAGTQSVVWNANVSSGIYYCRITAKSLDHSSQFSDTKKMLLLR
ncbi:MAG TPA: T9SS type A sorting domain-containing protein [Bacteroidota bacterium]|nr:T9SS type A sorting domain-containing protein [Bacteroidota bacterium]